MNKLQFTKYQTNNIISLKIYLEDCLKHDQKEPYHYWSINNTIRALNELLGNMEIK